MKLGFSTIGCPQWDWAEILGTAKDMGIDGLEIRGVEDEIDPMKITIFDAEHLEKTRTQLAQAGIEIAMIASSVVLGDPMGSREGEQQMVQAKNQIDFASQNGIPFVRVLLTLDPNPVPADLPAAKERYEQLCSYAGEQKCSGAGGKLRFAFRFGEVGNLYCRCLPGEPRRAVGYSASIPQLRRKTKADGSKPGKRNPLCPGQGFGG